jgi:hypothetical protein
MERILGGRFYTSSMAEERKTKATEEVAEPTVEEEARAADSKSRVKADAKAAKAEKKDERTDAEKDSAKEIEKRKAYEDAIRTRIFELDVALARRPVYGGYVDSEGEEMEAEKQALQKRLAGLET